ncbi:chlorovirus glyco repeat domain-containing [Tenacibaculum phage pT24]|uniref:Chlorovirus glyco repeat domain-containing n=1 Tax=Tenacibaculum phage pT24 TaxID=1880590 RepID=A0A1B4XWS0_9CAUD|nr:chlorovirus glyco repeat domain-containing [Tenacibaculum phage pT24]BAV39263.1 chlorovirus glyco repeat domain-containing [Tenacibaculum phage pT24]
MKQIKTGQDINLQKKGTIIGQKLQRFGSVEEATQELNEDALFGYVVNDGIYLNIMGTLTKIADLQDIEDAQDDSNSSSVVYYSNTAPTTNLAIGSLWYDLSDKSLKLYDGSDWNVISNDVNLTAEQINNINEIGNKLDKGTYEGTASDLKSDIDKKLDSEFGEGNANRRLVIDADGGVSVAEEQTFTFIDKYEETVVLEDYKVIALNLDVFKLSVPSAISDGAIVGFTYDGTQYITHDGSSLFDVTIGENTGEVQYGTSIDAKDIFKGFYDIFLLKTGVRLPHWETWSNDQSNNTIIIMPKGGYGSTVDFSLMGSVNIYDGVQQSIPSFQDDNVSTYESIETNLIALMKVEDNNGTITREFFKGDYKIEPTPTEWSLITKLSHLEQDIEYLQEGDAVPYTGAKDNVVLGDNYLDAGKEVEVLNTARFNKVILSNGTDIIKTQKERFVIGAWHPSESFLIGSGSGNANKGYRFLGIGINAGGQNQGDDTVGIGNGVLFNNTGHRVVGIGYAAGQNNTGSQSLISGYATGVNNSGVGATLLGYQAGHDNTANGGVFIGDTTGYSNTGLHSIGIGYWTAHRNTGEYSIGIGFKSLKDNKGANTLGIGANTLRYNTFNNNTAIGYNSVGDFNTDASTEKQINDVTTDVDVATNRITITSHGFGNVGDIVNLKYNLSGGGTAIGGLTVYFNNDSEANTFEIIDANTIEFLNANGITSTGDNTGTHTLTAQFVIENSTALGANSNFTKSNQIMLGDENINEVYSQGVFKSNADVTEITEDKHLISKEYFEDKGVPYTGATQKLNLGTQELELGYIEEVSTKSKYFVPFLYNGAPNYLRFQREYWNGSDWATTNGIGLGNNALINTSAPSGIGIGENSAHSNSGDSVIAIGNYAMSNNNGDSSIGIGTNAGNANTGNQSTFVGHSAGSSNSGVQTVAYGASAGFSNSGSRLVAVGYRAGYTNSGVNSTFIGHESGRGNTGSSNTGLGYRSLYGNQGNFNVALGYNVMSDNGGSATQSIGIGHSVLNRATGSNNIGIGHSSSWWSLSNNNVAIGSHTLTYLNEGSDTNTAIGYGSMSDFITENTFTTNNTNDFDVSNNLITITGHGLGSISRIVYLRYKRIVGSDNIGIPHSSSGTISQFEVIDANTLRPVTFTLSSAGTSGSTHQFETLKEFTNTTSLGANSYATKSNQVMLGDANVDEVYSYGVFKSEADVNEISDPKHLVTIEYLESNSNDTVETKILTDGYYQSLENIDTRDFNIYKSLGNALVSFEYNGVTHVLPSGTVTTFRYDTHVGELYPNTDDTEYWFAKFYEVFETKTGLKLPDWRYWKVDGNTLKIPSSGFGVTADMSLLTKISTKNTANSLVESIGTDGSNNIFETERIRGLVTKILNKKDNSITYKLDDGLEVSVENELQLTDLFNKSHGSNQNLDLGENILNSNNSNFINDTAIHFEPFTVNDVVPFRVQNKYWGGSSWVNALAYGIGQNTLLNNKGARVSAYGIESAMNNTGGDSNAYGYQALKNNTGSNVAGFGNWALESNSGIEVSGFGHNVLRNNTGLRATGMGVNAGTNNTGGYLVAIGGSAGANNTGTSSVFVGYQSGQSNTGNYVNGIGHDALKGNTGTTVLGFGYRAGMNNNSNFVIALGSRALHDNTASNSIGIGESAGFSNSGSNSTFIGDYSGQNNTGLRFVGIGSYTGQNNTGDRAIFIGYTAGATNLGDNTIGMGEQSLEKNVGDNNIGIGYRSGRYVEGSSNTFIGHEAWYEFTEDTTNHKVISNANIDHANERLTVTSHGLGSTGKTILVKFTTAGTFPSGLNSTTVFPMEIIDANTLEFKNHVMNDAGTGDLTLIPQLKITNSVALGFRSKPTKSNQVVLGGDFTEEVYSEGLFKSNVEIAEITDDKHLATREFVLANGGKNIWKPLTNKFSMIPKNSVFQDTSVASNNSPMILIPLTLTTGGKFEVDFSVFSNQTGNHPVKFSTKFAVSMNESTPSVTVSDANAILLTSSNTNYILEIGQFNGTLSTWNGLTYLCININTTTDALDAYSQVVVERLTFTPSSFSTNVTSYIDDLYENITFTTKRFGNITNSATLSENDMLPSTSVKDTNALIGESTGVHYDMGDTNVITTNMNKSSNYAVTGFVYNGTDYFLHGGSSATDFTYGTETGEIYSNTEDPKVWFKRLYEFFETNVGVTLPDWRTWKIDSNSLVIPNTGYGSTYNYTLFESLHTVSSSGSLITSNTTTTNFVGYTSEPMTLQTIKVENTSDDSLVKYKLDNGDEVEVLTWKQIDSLSSFENDQGFVTSNDAVPYTGAINDVNLGDRYLLSNNITERTNFARHYAPLRVKNNEIRLRFQSEYWNGSSWGSTSGVGLGLEALSGSKGLGGTGIGDYALQNNTGNYAVAIGGSSGVNNTGHNSIGIGSSALYANSADNVVAIGGSSAQSNTGSNSIGIGHQSLFSNSGQNAIGIGYQSGGNNTGTGSIGIGFQSIYYNTVAYTIGIGYQAGRNNTGQSATLVGYHAGRDANSYAGIGIGSASIFSADANYLIGIGNNAGYSNKGQQSISIGYSSGAYSSNEYGIAIGSNAGERSTGNNNTAIGRNSLKYAVGDSNTALGQDAFNDIITYNDKSIADNNTDIDIANDRITINSHGFGANGSVTLIQYSVSSGGTSISGLSPSVPIRIEIIDANTFEFVDNTINSIGSGTHTFSLLYSFQNSTAIGHNAQPTKSNQVVLGDNIVTEVYSDGVFKSNASVSEITEDKHLVTVEYLENVPNDGNFAIVKSGAITHTPAFGNINKYFNDINDVLDEIRTNTTKYDYSDFKIILVGNNNTFTINNDESYNYRGITIQSSSPVTLRIETNTNLYDSKILINDGIIEVLSPKSLKMYDSIDIIAKKVRNVTGGAGNNNPITMATSGDDSKINIVNVNVAEYEINRDLGGQGIMSGFGFDEINLTIGKLICTQTTSSSLYMIQHAPREGQIGTYNFNIGEVDVTGVTGGYVVLFNNCGLSPIAMTNGDYSVKYGGTFNIELGDIKGGTNFHDFRVFNGLQSGIFNFKMHGTIDHINAGILLHTNSFFRLHFTATGYIESTNNTRYLFDCQDQTRGTTGDFDKSFVHLKDLVYKNDSVNARVARTRFGQRDYSGTLYDPLRLIIENVDFESANATNAIIVDADSVNNYPITRTNPVIEFRGTNKFLMVNTATYLLQASPDATADAYTVKALVNNGKIMHNAVNANYADGREIVNNDTRFTNIL